MRGTFRRPMATTDPKFLESSPIPLTDALMEGLKQRIQHVQDYALLSLQSITNLFRPPYYLSDVLDQMDIIGVGSLPIVVLTGFFIGAVMVLQTAAQFVRFGQTALTADAVSLALVRELGPTITGLLVAGRNASGIASELGSMVVTEQVDAMRAMGTDPTRKLVTPRVIATVVLDARDQNFGFFRPDAGTFQTAHFRFHPLDGGLLPGVEGTWRDAGRRSRDDAGGCGLLGIHPRHQFLPDESHAVPGRPRFLIPRNPHLTKPVSVYTHRAIVQATAETTRSPSSSDHLGHRERAGSLL